LGKLTRIDKYFIVILSFGLILRLLSLINVSVALDSYTYLVAAKNILDFDYNSFRVPGFPIFIIPFLLLPYNYPMLLAPESKIALVILTNPNLILTAQIASMTAGILLIISSYFVFSKAVLKLNNKEGEINQNKSKYFGLIVSCLISFSLPFIINSVEGLREQLLAVLIIIIFYFIIIKDELTLRDNILLALSACLLTLTHLTAGIFITIGIFLFFLISKSKWFKDINIPNSKIVIILLATIISFLFWALFCDYKFADPLYSLQVQRDFFKDTYNLDLSSINNLIPALINGMTKGIPSEFYFLFIFNGVIFMILGLYQLIINIRQKQFLFIFFVFVINFAYLSIFMAIPGDLRLILYFFPILLYLGALPLGKIISDTNQEKSYLMNLILIIFFSTFLFRGLPNIDFFRPYFENFQLILIYWIIIIINELSLLIYLIRYRKYIRF
jgi:hypothetical protein